MKQFLGKKSIWKAGIFLIMAIFGGMLAMPATSFAVPPVVKTVPWLAENPGVPHDTWSGKTITLKGTSDVPPPGVTYTYSWDFGDGSAPATGTVTNPYVIEAMHAYSGSVGDVFTARLTVTNTSTSESATKQYFVTIRPQILEVEVNVAIDEGLWYLHKTQERYPSGGIDYGRWTSGMAGGSGYTYYALTALNVNAFEVNGHLESGDAATNPYVETVQRGLHQLFAYLRTVPIGPQAAGDPDSNGNGYGVESINLYPPYVGGIFIGAIVSSGTPDAVTTTGPAASGANPGILGRTYQDIVQDMVDMYAYGQAEPATGSPRGGWRYGWNYPNSDNSVCQWAAIGILAAERTPAHIAGDVIIDYWAVVPAFVKTENDLWLAYSQNSTTGTFGYSSISPVWGYYAVTPSGMVQMVMDGIGRGNTRWDNAETFMRNNFCNTGGAGNAVRDYYYGLFSFTKAMLLHDSDGDGIPDPDNVHGIELLQSQTPGVSPIDWYGAESSRGDPCDGVARTLVNDQNPAGYWYGHNYTGAQYYFETGWAIIMLVKTVTDLPPTAIAEAIPNPTLDGETVKLDGSASRANYPNAEVVSWEWDIDNDGTFDLSGPVVNAAFTCPVSPPCSFDVVLKVTDNQSEPLSDEAVITVFVVPPPVPPSADADGPYVFCPQTQPWFLDGTGSVNPDEGLSEPGMPGNTIIEYAWDLDLDGQFDDAFGPQPDVTAFFTGLGTGGYFVQLRVTDNSSVSHPVTSNTTDLSDNSLPTAVLVLDAADPSCSSCVNDLTARAKSGKVQLVWTDTGAVSYNVYRSTSMGGPYTFLANTTSTYSTYLDANVTDGITYYYVVREVALNTDELCQSNEVSATPTARVRRR